MKAVAVTGNEEGFVALEGDLDDVDVAVPVHVGDVKAIDRTQWNGLGSLSAETVRPTQPNPGRPA